MAKRSPISRLSLPSFPLVGRLLGALAILFPAPLAHAGVGADGTIMIAVCTEGRTTYIPLPFEENDERPASSGGCHAPCLCDRKRPVDHLKRFGPRE